MEFYRAACGQKDLKKGTCHMGELAKQEIEVL
jgi:hypothetical protein